MPAYRIVLPFGAGPKSMLFPNSLGPSAYLGMFTEFLPDWPSSGPDFAPTMPKARYLFANFTNRTTTGQCVASAAMRAFRNDDVVGLTDCPWVGQFGIDPISESNEVVSRHA